MSLTTTYTWMMSVVGCTAMLIGCTDGGKTLLVLQNQAPDAECVISTDPSAAAVARGLIDTESEVGYQFTPVLQNIATEIMDNAGQRIAILEGADIKLTLVPGLLPTSLTGAELQGASAGEMAATDLQAYYDSLTRFSQRFSGVVQPEGTTAVQFPIVSKALLEAIEWHLSPDGTQPTSVEASIRVFGTMDGSEIQSQEFIYYVDICRGCMKVDNGVCTELDENFEAAAGGNCNQLQDVKVDCCKVNTQNDTRSEWRCPAVASAPPES